MKLPLVVVSLVALAACGAGTPSPADQAAVVSYSAALQNCIAQAKVKDGGTTADYEACAHKVDATYGVPEGGM